MNVASTINQLPLAIQCYKLLLSVNFGGEPINNIEYMLDEYNETAQNYANNILAVDGINFDLSSIDVNEKHSVKNFLKINNIRGLVEKEQYRLIRDDLLQLVAFEKIVNELIETYGEFIND